MQNWRPVGSGRLYDIVVQGYKGITYGKMVYDSLMTYEQPRSLQFFKSLIKTWSYVENYKFNIMVNESDLDDCNRLPIKFIDILTFIKISSRIIMLILIHV